MKPSIPLLLSFFFALNTTGQECNVMLDSLKGSYIGEYRKGLANGTGTATGTDSYTGQFKNGYPDGNGKYTRKNGEYKGKFEKPYTTEMLTNYFTSNSVKKKNTLISEITFTVKNTTAGGSTNNQPVLPKSEIKNIQLVQGNYTELVYDSTSQVTNRYTFRNIMYPFSAIITFERARSVQQVAIAKIKLNENGNWMIRVDVEQ